MKNLDEKSWKGFELSQLAEVTSGRDIYAHERVQGNTPYITSGSSNNGIGYFVSNGNESIARNSISVNRNGAVGEAFYHPYKALYGNDCRRVTLRASQSPEAQLFVARAISLQKGAFSYSRKLGTARLKKLHIMLPVTESGEPDYHYMTRYTQRKRENLLKRDCSYMAKRMDELGEPVDIPKLNEKKWNEFLIGERFSVSRPGARNKDDYSEGSIPFVASGSVNNGVMKFCAPLRGERLDEGCCITVSPVDGSTFYQPADFLGRGGAGSSILILRCAGLRLYHGLFLARMIQQTCSKYTYGHMGNKDSIRRERILLPVNEAGEPDVEYMEQYVKNMMRRKYRQYLAFLDRVQRKRDSMK